MLQNLKFYETLPLAKEKLQAIFFLFYHGERKRTTRMMDGATRNKVVLILQLMDTIQQKWCQEKFQKIESSLWATTNASRTTAQEKNEQKICWRFVELRQCSGWRGRQPWLSSWDNGDIREHVLCRCFVTKQTKLRFKAIFKVQLLSNRYTPPLTFCVCILLVFVGDKT